MMAGFLPNKKDNRNKLWAELEKLIQKNAEQKDASFILKGGWKKFIKKQGGLKIFAVNGDWVRKNLSVTFHHGGHGFVHEFIPFNELWIATHHPEKCECEDVRPDRKMSQRMFKSTTLHELIEFQEMSGGKKYWLAHQIALRAEVKAGFLKNPYKEQYEK